MAVGFCPSCTRRRFAYKISDCFSRLKSWSPDVLRVNFGVVASALDPCEDSSKGILKMQDKRTF